MMAAVAIAKYLESGHGKGDLKVLVIITTVLTVGYYGFQTFDAAVLSIHGDKLQTFIAESIERNDEFAGANAYIQVRQEMEDGSVWNANNIFIAETEGNFKCKSYGVSGYLDCQEKKVIYISREDYENMKEMLTGEILSESEDYLMLGDCL